MPPNEALLGESYAADSRVGLGIGTFRSGSALGARKDSCPYHKLPISFMRLFIAVQANCVG